MKPLMMGLLVIGPLIGLLGLPARAAELLSLQGTVRDGSHAVIPGALVSLIEEGTGFQFDISSDDSGQFHLTLPAGRYDIVVRRVGFRTASSLAVPVAAGAVQTIEFELQPGSVFETVTVVGAILPEAASGPGEQAARPDDVANVPQNDRTVSGLLRFIPGLLATPANNGDPGQVSSLGARPNTNAYFVDGLSANNAVAGGGWPSFLPVAALPAMTALGTTHDLAAYDSIDEVRVAPDGIGPEGSRAAGAVITVHTKSGTDDFHGSIFYSVRPGMLAANDWFANRSGQNLTLNSLNDAGISASGPVIRQRMFFFLAGEELRLQQPYSWTTTVPSDAARLLAPASLQPLLALFPPPNGPALGSGLEVAELSGSKVFPANLSTINARLDYIFNPRTKAFLRLADTPSRSEEGFTDVDLSRYRNTAAALGLTYQGTRWTEDTRFGLSRTAVQSTWLANGAAANGDFYFYSQFPSVTADFASLTMGGAGSVSAGQSGSNRQDTMEIVHTAALRTARHNLQFGLRYLELHPVRNGPLSGVNISVSAPTDPLYGPTEQVWETWSLADLASVRLHQVSAFWQDVWSVSPRLQITFGLRASWLPAPRIPAQSYLYSVNGPSSPTQIEPLPAGTPLWRGAIPAPDPNVSLAWLPSRSGGTVIRAYWTQFHDSGFEMAANLLNPVPWFAERSPEGPDAYFDQLLPVPLGYGFSSGLRLPVYQRWSVSAEKQLAGYGLLQISYAGMSARNLERMEAMIDPSPTLEQIVFATSQGISSYQALNATYRRPLTGGLSGSVAYSWSHCIDVGSSDTSLFLMSPGMSAQSDRGNCDFDARQRVTAALSYAIPSSRLLGSLGKGWTAGTMFYARTAFPLNILASDTFQGFAIANLRPDLVPGVPLWIPDAGIPGGRELNPAAFVPTPNVPGTLGRNFVPGFGMWQADTSISRSFALGETMRLMFRAEAFNVFNHPLFSDPMVFLSNPMFGQSGSSLNLMMGSGSPASGQSPAFQMGGPRSLQLTLRLSF